MFRTLTMVILIVGFWGTEMVRAESAGPDRPQIVVALYNDAHVAAAPLSSAQDRAAKILRRAGVDLIWQSCGDPDTRTSQSCPQTSASGHFALRIVLRSQNLKSEIFGVAFLGKDGYGTQADVFFDEVAKLNANSSVSLPDLLGSVIAHELGHLILGTSSHASSGIMRRRWESVEVSSMRMGSLVFDPEQAEQMRNKLLPSREPPIK